MLKSVLVAIFGLLACISTVQGYFGDSSYVRVLTKFKKYMNFVMGSTRPVLIVYGHPNCKAERCRKMKEIVDMFAKAHDGLVEVGYIDCDEAWYDTKGHKVFDNCNPKLRDALPQFSFWVPPKERFNPAQARMQGPEEKPITKDVSYISLSDLTYDYLHYYGKMVRTPQEVEDAFKSQNPRNLTKVFLFNNNSESHFIFKGLSAEFYNRLEFFMVPSKRKDVQKMFGVKKIPAIVVAQPLDENDKEFKNRTFFDQPVKSFRSAAYWLEKYAIKIERRSKREQRRHEKRLEKASKEREAELEAIRENQKQFEAEKKAREDARKAKDATKEETKREVKDEKEL